MTEYAIEGQAIARICIDFAVLLQTAEGVELRIETAFAVASSDDSPLLSTRAEDLGGAGGHVLALLGQRVRTADIDESGRLELTFDGGGRLVCEPDEWYEAWSMTAPGGERIVCSPGGGTVRWVAGS